MNFQFFKAVIPPKVDPIRQTVDRDQPARFKCWVPGNSNVQLRWSRPGGAPLPSGVQEQQGILHIPRASDQEVGQYVCTATDPSDNTPLQSEPVQLNIRDPAPPQRGAAPQIDPPNQTVNVNDPAQFRCWVPGQPRAQLKWSRKDGRPLPNGILERDGFLRIDKSQLHDAGEYECTSTEPDGSTQLSPPARLNVNQRKFFTFLCWKYHVFMFQHKPSNPKSIHQCKLSMKENHRESAAGFPDIQTSNSSLSKEAVVHCQHTPDSPKETLRFQEPSSRTRMSTSVSPRTQPLTDPLNRIQPELSSSRVSFSSSFQGFFQCDLQFFI